jgi:uncharacterized protein (DUF3820 family)
LTKDTLEFNNQPQPDPDELLALASMRMPFGKYRGRLLIDLPEPYVVWFANNGFPEGKLGKMLQAVYEIKVNGLEYLFIPLRQTPRPRGS